MSTIVHDLCCQQQRQRQLLKPIQRIYNFTRSKMLTHTLFYVLPISLPTFIESVAGTLENYSTTPTLGIQCRYFALLALNLESISRTPSVEPTVQVNVCS